jgi:hypothetical protein
LQNPGSSFLKAAKSGVVDNLQGNLDALGYGNCLPMGTSGQFDIIYSEKVKLFIFLCIKLIASIEVLIDNPCLLFQKPLECT